MPRWKLSIKAATKSNFKLVVHLHTYLNGYAEYRLMYQSNMSHPTNTSIWQWRWEQGCTMFTPVALLVGCSRNTQEKLDTFQRNLSGGRAVGQYWFSWAKHGETSDREGRYAKVWAHKNVSRVCVKAEVQTCRAKEVPKFPTQSCGYSSIPASYKRIWSFHGISKC